MKKKMITLMLVFGLLSITLGVSMAFFNYTRIGGANNLRTGSINFRSSQNTSLNLTNVFPISREEALNDNSENNSITINIEGDTTYQDGIEYLLSITESNIEVNNKKVPISLIITPDNLGDSDEDYFTNRGGSSSIYKKMFESVEEDNQILVGYIAGNDNGINGSVTIKAFIDSDKVAISDTYDGTESGNMGTTTDWVNNRTVFTTDEWRSLSSSGLSFKIKVEANEGIWVEEQQTINVMNTFPTTITSNKNSITDIKFVRLKDAEMEQRCSSVNICEDITYNNEGKVLSWLEENASEPSGIVNTLQTKPSFLTSNYIDDNEIEVEQIDNEPTYTLYVASGGKTYLTTGDGLFKDWFNVKKIIFDNINTERVTSMHEMFYNLSNLEEINIESFDTKNVTDMSYMFYYCKKIENLDLSKIDMTSAVNLSYMFYECTELKNIDFSNRGGNNITNMAYMFYDCTSIDTLDMSNFNFGQITGFNATTNYLEDGYSHSPFLSLSSNYVNLNNNDFSKMQIMQEIFSNSVIQKIDMNYTVFASYEYGVSRLFGESTINTINLEYSGGDNAFIYYSIFDKCNVQHINMSHFNFGNTTSLFSMFRNVQNSIKTVDLSNANTSNIIYMHSLFEACKYLRYVNLSNIDTSNVTAMSYMFNNCIELRILDLSNFNMQNVTSLNSMFYGCTNLRAIYVSNNWSLDKVNLSGTSAFYNNSQLVGGNGTIYTSSNNYATYAVIDTADHPGYLTLKTDSVKDEYTILPSLPRYNTVEEIYFIKDTRENINRRYNSDGVVYKYDYDDIKVWMEGTKMYVGSDDTIYITSANKLFYGLSNLTKVDLTNLNTSLVVDFSYMLYDCDGLDDEDITYILNNIDTSKAVKMYSMFAYSTGITKINLSGLGSDSLTDIYSIFSGCTNLEEINMSNFNFGKFESLNSMGVGGLSKLEVVNLANAKMDYVKYMQGMFSGCTALKSVDLSNIGGNNLETIGSIFYNCVNLEEVKMNNFNLGKVVDMSYMFYTCLKLTSINFQNIDTSKVTNMSYMFYTCQILGNEMLATVLSNLNMSAVTNMNSMFQNCIGLTVIDLSDLGNDNLTDVYSIFSGCTNLKEIDMSNFNFGKFTSLNSMGVNNAGSSLEKFSMKNAKTVNVLYISNMFAGCSKLTDVDLTGIDTSKITDMYNLFASCSNLVSLDLSSFDTSAVTSMTSMFYGCTSLTTIYVSNTWNVSSVTGSDNMFYECISLVGGANTAFDENAPIDKTRAKVDGGQGNEGYLTLKTS